MWGRTITRRREEGGGREREGRGSEGREEREGERGERGSLD